MNFDHCAKSEKNHLSRYKLATMMKKYFNIFCSNFLHAFYPHSIHVQRIHFWSNFKQVFFGPWEIMTHFTSCFSYFSVKTCGKPHIQNIMSNVTAKPGQMASFKCQVDMSCIVAYIEWYHEMDNGTEKLIKVGESNLFSLLHYLLPCYAEHRSTILGHLSSSLGGFLMSFCSPFYIFTMENLQLEKKMTQSILAFN